MKKRVTQLFWCLLLLLNAGQVRLLAQTITTTFANNNGNASITFNFANNNAYPVIITEIGSVTGTGTSLTAQAWYNTVPVNSATAPPAVIPANGWTQFGTGTFTGVVNTTTTTAQTFLTGLSLTIPPATTYGICIGINGSLRYSSLATTGTVLVSAGGCDLITGTNIGWAGPAIPGTFTFTNRGFIGYITFVQGGPCIDPPTAGTSTAIPATVCATAPVALNLTGGTGGTGQVYQWESSANIGGSYFPVGGVLTSPALTINPAATEYYRCQVTCGAGTDVSVPVLVNVNPGLAGGSYTINNALPTGGGNYASFTDAVAALSCGIAGSVTFNVAPGSGPYNEQVTIPPILGASSANTVIFNGNGATLTYAASLAATPHTLLLDGADYIAFDNLNIVGTGGTYALACHLWNQADNNTFSNCTFTVPANNTVTTQAPFSISGSASVATTAGVSGNNNIITNCTMNGGYYSACIVGNTTAVSTGNQLLNCNLRDCYSYGSYNLYQNGLLIRGNTIERPTRTNPTTLFGIFVSTGCINLMAEKNIVRNPYGGLLSSTGIAYGIYSAISATAGNENKYINNLIYNMNGNGPVYGMYFTAASYVNAYHNTIVLDDQVTTTGIAYGLYQLTTAVTNFDFRNNIVSVTRAGSGAKRCIYFALTTSTITSNNNVLHMGSTGGTNNYTGQWGTNNYATLGNWQTANGGIYDAQSQGANPLFVSPASGDFTPTEPLINDIGAALSVGTDILGNPRDLATPDPGAFEFSVAPCTGTPNAGTASAPVSICVPANVTLTLTGYTTGGGITFQWERFDIPTLSWVPLTGATSPAFTVIGQTATTDYHCVVTCGPSSQSAISNTVTVNVNNFYSCYCIPTSGGGASVSNVTIATTTFNNNSGVAPAPNYYESFPAVGSATCQLAQTGSYTISTTTNVSSITSVWIDYNHSGTFDASEWTQIGTTGTAQSATLNIPLTAQLGTTGMRIRTRTTGANGPGDACTAMTGGETEDYLIEIIPAPPCSGMPSAGIASGPTQAFCISGNAVLALNGYSAVSALTFQWEYNTGSGWQPLAGATTPNYTVNGLTATTDYHCVVTCTNSGLSATSNTITVTVNNPTAIPYPGSRCGTGSVLLVATPSPSNATVKWYSVPTGGAPLATGNAFITPALAATTTYYVEATNGAGVTSVGLINANSTATSGAGTTNFGLVFDVYAPFTLNSVKVYPVSATSAAGTVTVDVINSSGTVLNTATFNVVGSPAASPNPYVLNLNFNLVPGTNLKMRPGFTGITGLLFEPAAAAPGGVGGNYGYPFTIPGVVSILTSTLTVAPTNTPRNDLYYYFYNWQVSTGCAGARVPVTATINAAPSGTGLSTGGTVVGNNHTDGANLPYNDACGDKVATINDAVGGNVLGITTAIVATSSSVQTFNGAPYVPRVYDIAPASSGPATATVYALQSEFNAYNSYVTSNSLPLPLLPASPLDPNVANIVITQFHGAATAGTTGPNGLYNAANDEFIASGSITKFWNPAGYWELTFPVTGFSGFFIHSGNGPLAIGLKDITATNVGSRNRVDWNTATESTGDYFIVERSADGRNFTALGNVNAKGQASSYNYWDENPVSGINYYRLKLMDAANHAIYSKVVTATVKDANAFSVDAYPNPVSENLTIKVYGQQGSNAVVTISDATGKIVRIAEMKNAQTIISMNGLASGMYLVKYSDNIHTQTLKVNKQ